ncbi:MAG: M6 family metalloprotease domain-containing protein [candidate division WOR-3 bacterium]
MRLFGFVLLSVGLGAAMPPMPGNSRKILLPGKLERPSAVRPATDRTGRLLVILVDFNDNIHRFPGSEFQQLIFGSGTGSMRDYYREVSFGSLLLSGDVAGWIRLSNPYSYYLGDSFGIYGSFPHNSQGLVRDLVSAIDGAVDFSRYDWDGDGFVDGLLIVHAGPGAEETGEPGDIWSHKWQLSDDIFGSPGPVQTGDGVSVDEYSIQPERFLDGNIISIGVFCHEFGHLLGLPDLYDTDYSSSGLGMFCLMAAGGWARADTGVSYGSSPTHPSIWCKYLLGWVVPDSVQPGYRDSLSPALLAAAATAPAGYRILENPGGVDWSFSQTGNGEYFLIENRQRFGFDRGLPGVGILILHIDESRPDNSDERHPLVGILRADRSPRFALDAGDRGSDVHLWKASDTGVRNFTTPSTAFYNGIQSGVVIEQISGSDSIMTATLKISPMFLGRVYSFPNPVVVRDNQPQATIAYMPTDSVRLAGQFPDFKIRIFNIAGEPVRLLDEPGTEIVPRYRAGFWNLRNEQGKPVTSGMYFYIVEIEEDGVIEQNVGRLTVVR